MLRKKDDHKKNVGHVETTGHEWDGLEELNNPAPRWWIWVFLITIVWAIGYWVVYPAWPTLSGNTKGTKAWTEYTKLHAEQAEIMAIRQVSLNKIQASTLEQIAKDPTLYNVALVGGRAAFRENCAACHGTGGQGGKGYPNLNDDDWLWGGDLEAIYTTIKYGIRSSHEKTRDSQMPAFGKTSILTQDQISDVGDYVLSLSTGKGANAKGETIFKEQCSACHGSTGHGSKDVGAPNLADAIWLYGGTKQDIQHQVTNPKHGVMPTWETRLSDATIKQLAIYVHELGGGEKGKSQ
ncbi:MAG: cytochrome-c oxidase, cbb3-type subunit III [Alphaproteobacteria bacterium]|nr:cytochrome-c oxidase, cbb3-type subunit III [Alphaproteobacteria bacterium]